MNEITIILENEAIYFYHLYLRIFRRRSKFDFILDDSGSLMFENHKLVISRLDKSHGIYNDNSTYSFYFKTSFIYNKHKHAEITFSEMPYKDIYISHQLYRDLFNEYTERHHYDYEDNKKTLFELMIQFGFNNKDNTLKEKLKSLDWNFNMTDFMFLDYILEVPKDIMWVTNKTIHMYKKEPRTIKLVNIQKSDLNFSDYPYHFDEDTIKKTLMSILGMYIELTSDAEIKLLKTKYKKLDFKIGQKLILICKELIDDFPQIITSNHRFDYDLITAAINHTLDLNIHKIILNNNLITEKVFYHELGHAIYASREKENAISDLNTKEYHANYFMSTYKQSIEYDALLILMTRFQPNFYRPTYISDLVSMKIKENVDTRESNRYLESTMFEKDIIEMFDNFHVSVLEKFILKDDIIIRPKKINEINQLREKLI